MTDAIRQARTGLLVLALLSGLAGQVVAQGVTGAAVQGTVGQIDSSRVEGARVELKSTQGGQTYTATTGANGRYFIDNVQPGSGYTLTVTAIGFRPTTRAGIVLALGQRLNLDVGLAGEAVQLEELQVTAAADPLINAARTGPSGLGPVPATRKALARAGLEVADLDLIEPTRPSPRKRWPA